MLLTSPLAVYAVHGPIIHSQSSVGITEPTPTATPKGGNTPSSGTGPSQATPSQPNATGSRPVAVPTPAPLAPQGHAVTTTVPVGFKEEAQDSTLTLYVEPCTGQLAIKDKRSGIVWLSNPRPAGAPAPTCTGSAPPSQNTANQETTPVWEMQYTDYQRQVPKLLLSGWDPTPPQISHLPDGDTRLTFTPKVALKGAPISFAMDIHLGDGYFDVTIPQNQVKEQINDQQQSGYYLQSIEPLPFFGAGADDEQGYMVIPDGSGALVRFKPIHPDYLQPFNEEVYGQDVGTPYSSVSSSSGSSYFGPSQEPVMIPALGIATKTGPGGKPLNAAFVEIATQGQFDSIVDEEPSGYITRYYHGGFQFIYRRMAAFPRNRYSFVNRLALQMVEGNRSVRFYLLNGSQANYSGMAAAYRQYLEHHDKIQPLKEANAPLNLSLIMGARKKGLIAYTLVPATTFSEAQQILQTLRDRGVERLQLTLQGWNRDGLYQAMPNRMPADDRLGGNAGLKQLTAYAKTLNVPVYLLNDFESALSGERGYFAHNDAMRGANKLPLFSNGAGLGQSIYLLNPIVEMNNFVLRDVPKEKLLGASGADILYFGQDMAYDTNSAHPLTRQQYADWNMKIVDYVRQELGSVAVQGGNAYILGHVKDVRGVPVDDSHWQFEDEAIPFYQLVMHGFIRYTPETYANLRSDPQIEFLREVEYGADPSFELTYMPTSGLNRALVTYTDWSSTWTNWIDDLVREYEDVNVQLGSTFNQFMINHQQLAPNVYETTYANGVRVIVNYSRERFTNGKVAVDALSYAVVPAGS
ncbi:MAG: DUF5696 domain-containing protein [Chloroflexi bacterium]|nr:DUF5696 domain-containing protein [Chloroflexota bacterium]